MMRAEKVIPVYYPVQLLLVIQTEGFSSGPYFVFPCCILQDGKEHVVKEVSTGDNIHSLLSILDVLTVSRLPNIQISKISCTLTLN